MALSKRWVVEVNADATGAADTNSGSSATIKDSNTLSSSDLNITNDASGSYVTRVDAAAFAGTPTTLDTLYVGAYNGGGVAAALYHVRSISADGKTLTLNETPATKTSDTPTWTIGGRFLTIGGAAGLVQPTNQISMDNSTGSSAGAGPYTVTINTTRGHGLSVGDVVTIGGSNVSGTTINGARTVTAVPDDDTYEFSMAANPGTIFDPGATAAYVAGSDDHVYVKAGAGYSISVKITFSKAAGRSRMLVYEGYTTTPGDGGRATIDNTTSGGSGRSIEANANDQMFRNFYLTNSGAGNLFSCIGMTGTSRYVIENCYGSVTAANSYFHYATTSRSFRCRGTSSASSGRPWMANGNGVNYSLFCVAHDSGSDGFAVSHSCDFCVVDTCGTGTANGGIGWATGQTHHACFVTVYNQGTTGDGIRLSDATGNNQQYVLGCILASNAGYGVNRQGVATGPPLHFEAYNDFFSNGTAARQNAEDTTGYDAAPTDKAVDPQFTDAAGQDFSIGTALKAGAAVAFQVGGTTYLDMGAVQRQEPAGGGGHILGGTVAR